MLPTFYFSPVDCNLCYGDFKTLGNIQELHIKRPVITRYKYPDNQKFN